MISRVDLSFVTLPPNRIAIYRRQPKRGWRKLADCHAAAGSILVRLGDSDGTGRLECTLPGSAGTTAIAFVHGPSTAEAAEPQDQASSVVSLSHRELQVLDLAALGITARDIGTRLCISPRTVETHLASGYRKLGVGSRLELVRHAADFGLTGRPNKIQ